MKTVKITTNELGHFVASVDGVQLTEVKHRSNLDKNIKNKMSRMGDEFKEYSVDTSAIKTARAPKAEKAPKEPKASKNAKAKVVEPVFAKSKATAKPGEYVKMFGTKVFEAYDDNGVIRFKIVK